MFQLPLKTNASLVCLLLLSSSPMALSSNVTGNDSETLEITNNNWSPLEIANAPDNDITEMVTTFEEMPPFAPSKALDKGNKKQKSLLSNSKSNAQAPELILKQPPKVFMEDMGGKNRAKNGYERHISALEKDMRYTASVLWYIAKKRVIDPDRGDRIVAQAPKLFTEKMNVEDKYKVIKALVNSPDSDISN